VAASAREIDGADKRDRNKKNDGGKKHKDDHHNLLNRQKGIASRTPQVHPLFSMG
jgi:hypothetical protein